MRAGRNPGSPGRVHPTIRIRTLWILLALLAPAPAAAVDLDSTFVGLPANTLVTVLKRDGSHERATFRGTVEDPPRLLLAEPRVRGWGGVREYELPRSEVAALEGRVAPTRHPRRILVATMAGMVVGGVIGAIVPLHPIYSPYPLYDAGSSRVSTYGFPGDRVSTIAAGAAAGTVLGLLVGLLITPSRGAAQRWPVSTLDPEPSAAPADSLQAPIR
ncbi:MAG: hypothetical protein ABI960_10015 [Candidatus Eisenbacteria bacterium]